jgi:hypothetical protein
MSDYNDPEFFNYMINESEKDGWKLVQLISMTNLLMVRETAEEENDWQEIKKIFDKEELYFPRFLKGAEKPQKKWIHNDHYHCKNCRTIIEYKFSNEWNVNTGVSRWGICPSCQTLLIETEKKGITWRDWIKNLKDLK